MTDYVGKILYRYKDYGYRNSYGNYITKIGLEKFEIIKETDKGYWYVPLYNVFLEIRSQKKWAKKRSRRPFAFLNKREAADDFKRRKIGQIAILKDKLEQAEMALNIVRNNRMDDFMDYEKEMPEMFLTEEDMKV